MNDATVSRWMGPLGLVTIIALFVGFGPLSGNQPSENVSGVKVAAFVNSHMSQEWAQIYVIGFGLALLVLFVTQLRDVLRDTSGQRLLPNVVFAAAVILVAGIIVDGTLQIVMILAAHNGEYAIVKTMNFVGQNNELTFLFGLALLTLATGFCILVSREAGLPKVLGWFSLLVGVVACAGPLSFFAILFGLPIWLVATGFVISTRARRNPPAAPVAEAVTAAV